MCEECGCGQSVVSCPQCGGSMILVDGEPVCASCGAIPHTHDHPSHTHSHGSHTHHHADHTHDHADHTHSHGSHTTPKDVAKLHILVPHWIEHNKDHAASLRDWASKARGAHLESVASKIEAAAIQMDACNQILSTALGELEGRGMAVSPPSGSPS